MLEHPIRLGSHLITQLYNWSITPYLTDQEFVQFWKSLSTKENRKRFIITAVQINRVLKFMGREVNTKFADYVQLFVMKAVHIHEKGWVTIPYELAYYEFDIDDGSADEEFMNEFSCQDKYNSITQILDWAVQNVLKDAFHDYKYPKKAICTRCASEGAKMQLCGNCRVAKYCSRECQKLDWKDHKPRCKELREAYEKKLQERRKLLPNETPEQAERRLDKLAFEELWKAKNSGPAFDDEDV